MSSPGSADDDFALTGGRLLPRALLQLYTAQGAGAFFGPCYLCLAVVPDSNSTLWLVSSCHSVLVVRTLSVLEHRQ